MNDNKLNSQIQEWRAAAGCPDSYSFTKYLTSLKKRCVDAEQALVDAAYEINCTVGVLKKEWGDWIEEKNEIIKAFELLYSSMSTAEIKKILSAEKFEFVVRVHLKAEKMIHEKKLS